MFRKLKMSFIINILIFVLTVVSTIFMLVGFQFMGYEEALTATKIEAFKFYTVDSNILMGTMALIFAIYELQFFKSKKNEIPNKVYILKLVATVGVVLTFLTTVIYLAPFAPNGYFSMFKNSNLFYHLIIPLLSIITFTIFESTDKIKFKDTFVGIITMFIYSIFYLVNVLIHVENGKVEIMYDWYGFVQNGLQAAFVVIPIMYLITYFISCSLWFLNKKISK